MKVIVFCLSAIMTGAFIMASFQALQAAQSTEDRRELIQIRKDLYKVSRIIRKKEFEEADQKIRDVEDRLQKLIKRSGISKTDIFVLSLQKAISQQRHTLAFRKNPKEARKKAATVSFLEHVAPILNARCVQCHGDDPAGKLHLDTFTGMKRGGESGPLLTPGSASRSLILARLTAHEKFRMPKKGPLLTRTELHILALWINQGAKFDGKDEGLELAELLKPKVKLPPLKFAKATGNEKVSFKRDIAPFLVESCQRCHQGKEPSGDLVITSYETLMRGGKNGPVVVSGQPEQSKVYTLMASFDEANRMPLEGKVKKKNFDDLKTWIEEGAKYDGEDPRLTLRALNPTADEALTTEVSNFSGEQFVTFRRERSKEQWQQTFSDSKPQQWENDDLLLFGDVDSERVEKVGKWADEHLESIRKLFLIEAGQPLWKGKLAIFIIKDRSGFQKFHETVSEYRVSNNISGSSHVTESFVDAYLVLHDIGDKSTDVAPALRINLIDQLTNAYLATTDASYPEWFTLGLGLGMASIKADRRDAYLTTLREETVESLQELKDADDVFRDGAFFSSEDTRPVGYTLTQFLLKRGGEKNMAALIKTMENGGEIGNSMKAVYGTDLQTIAKLYFANLKVRRKIQK